VITWGVSFLIVFSFVFGFIAEEYYNNQLAISKDPSIITRIGFYWAISSITMGFVGLSIGLIIKIISENKILPKEQ
jgi:hypothetical protein